MSPCVGESLRTGTRPVRRSGHCAARSGGHGAAAGDVIRFEGYGAGALVSFVSGAQWKVQGAAGLDTFLISGSFDPLHDAIFA